MSGFSPTRQEDPLPPPPEVTVAGKRVWEQLSNLQKHRLTHFLEVELSQAVEPAAESRQFGHSDSDKSWKEFVVDTVRKVIHRRAQCRESLDAHDVIEEVLPLARAKVPLSTREELFRQISLIITP